MEQIKQFIDMVASGNNSEARDTLDALLSTRAFEALEYKKQELASTLFAGQVEEEVEELTEQNIGNGYKIKMKHSDKGRIHAPSGEHIADVTRHESGGWAYHSGNSKWDGTEVSPHYKTGVEKTKAAAARKAAEIHASN